LDNREKRGKLTGGSERIALLKIARLVQVRESVYLFAQEERDYNCVARLVIDQVDRGIKGQDQM